MAFPFVLLAFILSMASLGMYHLSKLMSTIVKDEERKYMKNPVIRISNRMLDVAGRKILKDPYKL
jgi:hypothetical protein